MTSKSTARKKRAQAKAEELTVAVKERDIEIQRLRDQLAAASGAPSPSTMTPPGRATPAQRVPAPRPARDNFPSSIDEEGIAERETKDEDGEGDVSDQDDDDDDDHEGGDQAPPQQNGEDPESEEEPGGDEQDQRELAVMQALLNDCREQRLSYNDRAAIMEAAGGQFSALLAKHWKEKTTPPKWLVSLFRPTPPTSARLTQITRITPELEAHVDQATRGRSQSQQEVVALPVVEADVDFRLGAILQVPLSLLQQRHLLLQPDRVGILVVHDNLRSRDVPDARQCLHISSAILPFRLQARAHLRRLMAALGAATRSHLGATPHYYTFRTTS